MQQKITSFADVHRAAERFVDATKRHRYSLEHMVELLEFLGSPHKRLKVVHVAGTSGKTSTAYYTAALLTAAGKRVGLTVSPHVDEVNERVQIGMMPLAEGEFCRSFAQFLGLIKNCRVTPNYFELFVAFAFWEFAARRVDYAVVEVGVGGLLDSTNIFDDPQKVCAITDIGFDHVKVLGSTLTEIAAQKAGIIQLHNAVFCNRQSSEVMDAIREAAAQKQADLHMLSSAGRAADFDFLPLFQRRNFGLALETAQFVLKRDGFSSLDRQEIERAAKSYIPARMETMEIGGKILIIDVAHNAQKFHALAASLQHMYGNQPMAALIGSVSGQGDRIDWAADELGKLARHLVVTAYGAHRRETIEREDNKERIEGLRHHGAKSVEIVDDPEAAFHMLLARPEPVLVVTGSFYFLNHIRSLLRSVTVPS
ncbi:MAG TPA: Mur ligase family protein [Candidatus Saccharimonadales bacterium]